jgi:hypothetical protein
MELLNDTYLIDPNMELLNDTYLIDPNMKNNFRI